MRWRLFVLVFCPLDHDISDESRMELALPGVLPGFTFSDMANLDCDRLGEIKKANRQDDGGEIEGGEEEDEEESKNDAYNDAYTICSCFGWFAMICHCRAKK